MKIKKIVSILFIFNLYILGLTAQDTPQPIKVDEFVSENCESLMARMDNYFVELQNNPNATGYIFQVGKKGQNIRSLAVEERMKRYIQNRRFDPARILFVRAGMLENPRTEFWLVPAGADSSEIIDGKDYGEGKWSYDLSSVTRPFILEGDYTDVYGLCPTPDLFPNLLKANPKMRGNIVIYATSRAIFRKSEKDILSRLTKAGIERKRLRTFFVRKTKFDMEMQALQPEYWLLP